MSGIMKKLPTAKKINHQFLRQRSQVGKKKLITFLSLIAFNGSAADNQQGHTWRKICAYIKQWLRSAAKTSAKSKD